jgi:signal transduction histidine kinase
MVTAAFEQQMSQARARWWIAGYWAAALVVYCIAIGLANDEAAMWINDIAWTLASAAAAIACFRAARLMAGARRRAWLLLATGCVSWFIGQLHWNYSQLVLGEVVPFPSIGQIFYSAFAVFSVASVVTTLPDSHRRAPFTFKQLGNIGLVLCCLVVTVVLGILEPAMQANVPAFYLWIAFAHTVLVAATFLVTLYALWTFQWGAGWLSMLLLTTGACVYAVSNLIYAHSLLTRRYLPDDLINISWLVMFGLVAAAAGEQRRIGLGVARGATRTHVRERWLEAVVPALLIIIMVVVAVSSTTTMTPRVIAWTAGLFLLFAVILGLREAWIQKEAQRLTAQLVATNEQLQAANAELRLSEARYRELNTALEQRVAERTGQLRAAYDELEGFSYAVAHDLKAPLRAINGFAHLLEAELSSQLTPPSRDHLGRIRNGALRMATLIDDLLAYSHIDRRELQTSVVALPALVESVIGCYADEIQRRNVTVNAHVEQLMLRIDSDGVALALRNLFENALKYTRHREAARIDVQGLRNGAGVRLSFTDNGIGFDMEYHDHIFKIFQRLHRDDQYPGTGIGLALVRKAIERMGGRVWAESRPGEGATFHVDLPGVVV